ncbi:hypothetical protein FQA39_LY12989 [Lamprigera yunnana]|nr:hypothetical protein FQA39_LY12989 [Lamprigera yunnana]
MNIGKKYVREGNFQDDYIDEDEYKIYKAKIKRAEKEDEKIDDVLKLAVRTFCEIPGKFLCSSLKRLVPKPNSLKIKIIHFDFKNDSVNSSGQKVSIFSPWFHKVSIAQKKGKTMEKILVINASVSPKENSDSVKMSEFFISEYKKNKEVEVIELDLNKLPMASKTLTVDNMGNYFNQEDSFDIINQLKSVDKVVINFPMVNFGIPAILKNYIDHICIANETFTYKGSTDGFPIGLLSHLNVQLLATKGGFGTPEGGFTEYMLNIFGLTAGQHLTKEVCDILGVEQKHVRTLKFADGEMLVESLDSVRGQEVYIIQSASMPVNDNYMELFIAIDAFKRCSAEKINVVIPYYGYARQDRKAKGRQPITSKLIADFLTKAGAHRVITFDLHSPQSMGFFDIPVDNFYTSQILADEIVNTI